MPVKNSRVYFALLKTVSLVDCPPGAFSRKEFPNFHSSVQDEKGTAIIIPTNTGTIILFRIFIFITSTD